MYSRPDEEGMWLSLALDAGFEEHLKLDRTSTLQNYLSKCCQLLKKRPQQRVSAIRVVALTDTRATSVQ